MQVWALSWEDPLEKEMDTHSSIFAWRIPWAEELGRLQSMGLQRVGHDWATNTFTTLERVCRIFVILGGGWITLQSEGITTEKVWKGIWCFLNNIVRSPIKSEHGDENGLAGEACAFFYYLWWVTEGCESTWQVVWEYRVWNEALDWEVLWWNWSLSSLLLSFHQGVQTQHLEAWALILFEPQTPHELQRSLVFES